MADSALVIVLLAILAAARITRLLTHDELPPIEKLRKAIVERYGDLSPWAKLFGTPGPDGTPGCPWCLGFWIAVPASYSAVLWGDTLVWQLLALPWAASFVVSWLVARTADG